MLFSLACSESLACVQITRRKQVVSLKLCIMCVKVKVHWQYFHQRELWSSV